MRGCLAAALITLSLPSLLRATTVIPPSFEDMVARAEVVFEGEVVDGRAHFTASADGTSIVTDVSFRVVKVLKGAAPSTIVLQFLGGEVGDQALRVDGVPTFARGDRDVIFAVTSAPQVSPIVGFMHGRVRITADGAARQEIVRSFDGAPLRETGAIGARDQRPLALKPAMSLTAFEAAVADEVTRQAAMRGARR